MHIDDKDEEKQKTTLATIIQVLNRMDEAIVVIDDEDRIAASNRAAQDLFVKPGSDLIGQRIQTIIPDLQLLDIAGENSNQIQKNNFKSGETWVNLANGEKVWTNFHVEIMRSGLEIPFRMIIFPIDRIDVQQVRKTNQILSDVNMLFSDGGDFKEKLPDLAQLFIPEAADWCFIHLFEDDGSIGVVSIAPADIMKNQMVYDWIHNALQNDEVDGFPAIEKQRKSILVSVVSPVRRAAEGGIKSYIIAPLLSHQHLLGMLSLVSVEQRRHFDQKDLALADNLALHLATYLEKSQLHHESKKLNEELEHCVGEGSVELQETLVQLEQSEEMLQTLFRISNKLNATLDINVILDTLAQEAIQIVNGESGFAGLRTSEGMSVQKYFQQSVEIPFEHTWAPGEGIPGWVLKYKVPYGTSDAANDPLMRHELSLNANVRSVICTPILDTVGEVIAYFDIRNKQGAEGFSINDQEMLLTLAPVASIAIQNALAYQQRLSTVSELKESANQLQELAASLELAREEERNQIALELHDQLGQALTAMKFDIAWLTEQLEQQDEELAQKAKEISSQMNTLIKTVRRIATELRPGMLEDLGLEASIEWQARDFEKRTGIECKITLPDEELILTKDQSLAIFRIFQETLTNVSRYAEAKHVKVKLAKAGDLVTLELNDDGRGIKKEEISGRHSVGLLGMRERATHLGGTFEINGISGEGTTIKVTIPVRTIP